MVRSSRTKLWLLVLIAGVVGILALLLARREGGGESGVSPPPTASGAQHPSLPLGAPPKDSHTDPSEPRLAPVAPSVGDLRKQVEQDPHGTPPALLEFADEVASEMEGAFDSPENARSAVRMLEGCALPEAEAAIPQSAQALCAENIKRLAERYPEELRADWERVRAQLPARVLQLLER